MIIATIEYAWDQLIEDEDRRDMRERVESIVGDVFEEELVHVEVRMKMLDEDAIYERSLCFTIDVSEDTMHHDPEDLARQFIVEIKDQMPHLPPFWVWVRKVSGSFTESK